MKKWIKQISSLIFISFYTANAQAAWYQVTGESAIVSSDNQARQHALEDAVYKAVEFSGADIGSLSNLWPFLETAQTEYQFTNHEVRYIAVDKITKSGNKIYVTARVDIYPSARACHNQQYKKTLLVGDLRLISPQQAVMGQIYQLGEDYTKVVERQIDKQSHSFVSVGITPYKFGVEDPTRIQMLAQDTGAQYLIGGNIIDLTATIGSSASNEDIINRQFAMDLSIFDGSTGNQVFNKIYRDIGIWPFPKTSQVDTQSARFWHSTYGEMMLRVSRDVMLDLENQLACKVTLPEVAAKFGETITMDLGRVHGVQKGDQLQLWHTASFIDQKGISRAKVIESDVTLTVARVYETGADLTVDQPDLASSVQIGDVMHKILKNQ